MRIEQIAILNFGPFYGKHEIEFAGDGGGIHLIRGITGQGKTSIQRAILWGLYGRVQDRKGNEIRPTSLLNQTALKEGILEYYVKIHFNHLGSKWALTRKTITTVHQDKKYLENMELDLVNGDDVLKNPQREIERIIPFDVSRFFFFDGEMLRDFEELLDENNHSISILKNSIEKILGIPLLKTSMIDLEAVIKRLENERSRVIRTLGGKEYEALASDLTKTDDDISVVNGRIEKLQTNIENLEESISDKKRQLGDLKEVKEQADTRTHLESEVKKMQSQKEEKVKRMKEYVSKYYQTILVGIADNIIEKLEHEHDEKMGKYNRKIELDARVKEYIEVIKFSKCRICGTELTQTRLAQIKDEIKEASDEITKLTEIPEPNLMYDHYAILLRSMVNNAIKREKIVALENEILGIDSDIASKNAVIQEISDNIVESEAKIPAELERQIQRESQEMGRLEGLKHGEESDKSALLDYKFDLEKKLRSINQDELQKLTLRIEQAKNVLKVLDKAIEIFRNEKRIEVETESTKIFRRLRSKEYFSKLKINDNFGLSIITTDSTILDRAELRSAGEEQIVAISLMGALNSCAKVEAPIFMDTPFGRLDIAHGKRVLHELPNLSSQVVLLVTDREMRKGDEEASASRIKTDLTVIHKSQEEGSYIIKTEGRA